LRGQLEPPRLVDDEVDRDVARHVRSSGRLDRHAALESGYPT
jgi:hypothetical protein